MQKKWKKRKSEKAEIFFRSLTEKNFLQVISAKKLRPKKRKPQVKSGNQKERKFSRKGGKFLQKAEIFLILSGNFQQKAENIHKKRKIL